MGLNGLLTPDRVFVGLHARCKREALSLLAERAAASVKVDKDLIFDALLERENLGSTGVGSGVAIPHGKIDGLSEIRGFLARFDAPVDFDAIDDEPVDLMFLLLAPADATAAHLKALARVSRLLREEHARAALRGADTAEALYAVITEIKRSNAA